MTDELAAYFEPLSQDSPSGVDLEYDPEYARMEKAAQGTPDQEYGETHIEALPPDWEAVLDACQNLLERAKDLRVAVYYAHARLVLSGIRGLRDGLQLIAVFTDKFWDSVYPQLDADDDNDPTIRINALLALNKAGGLLRQLRETPILASRAVGQFTLVDCAIARGEIPPPSDMPEPPTQKKIDAAVLSCNANDLRQMYEAVEECLKFVSAIDSAFGERLGYATGPNLEALTKELKNIAKYHKTWLDQLKALEPPAPVAAAAAGEQAGEQTVSAPHAATQMISAAPNSAQPVVMGAGSFAIGRREDALEALDKIIRWFERFEPSSPLPMLLKRAKRLSTLSFMEILRDISPDGLNQAALIVGGDSQADSHATAHDAHDADDDDEDEPPTKSSRRVAPGPDDY
jgi:type VI secretion system protein ImpA